MKVGNIWSSVCGFEITDYNSSLLNKENNLIQDIPNVLSLLKYEGEISNKLVYSMIQKKHWDVSFLSQYTLAHLDRILMALPLIIISLNLIVKLLFAFNFKNLLCLNFENIFDLKNAELNLLENLEDCQVHDSLNDEKKDNDKLEKEEKRKRELVRLREIFIFYSYINFLINFILVVFFAHTQIINRVITCNPLLYFFYADKISDFTKRKSRTGRYIIFSFLFVAIIGCVMYPGGYGFA